MQQTAHQKETVLARLAAHSPTDEKEQHDVQFIRTFVTENALFFGKENTKGHITGSAFVVDQDKRVLLTFHRKLKRWLQLGGHSEVDETDPFETALREAHEESGLPDLQVDEQFGQRPFDIDVHSIPARRDEPQHDHLDFRYVLRTNSPERIVCSPESNALAWVPLSELDAYDFDPALRRAVDKLRSVTCA